MGCPNARPSGCANGAPSGRGLERALTDTQLASGKSLVVIYSSAVPRLDAVSVRSSRPHQRPTTAPAGGADRISAEEPFPFLRDSGVISGEISWPERVMRRLAHMPRFAVTEGEGVPLGSSLRSSEVAYLRE
jgi:hypothetical protein